MSKIYRVNDIIEVKVEGLVFGISPLSLHHKMDIESDILRGDTKSAMSGAAKAVKYSVKSVSGVKTADNEDYELEFEDGVLSDSCIDDLFNLPETEKLTLACLNLLKSIPDEFVNPHTGKPIEGVKIIKSEEPSGKKKKAASRS